MKSIGSILKELRGEKSMSFVANKVGITTQALWNYENNVRIPRDEIKIKLSEFYKIRVDKIFFNKHSNS